MNISQPGAAPTEIENQVTQIVESAVRNINGVKNLNSTASEGNSNTFIEFEIGIDPNDAVNEVKNAVDQVRGALPDGIIEPRVSKVDVTAARETHRRLSEDYPDSSFTPVASLELHGALKKLRKEAEEKGETESAAQTLREMAELLEFANKNAVKFSFKNTRTEASHWYDLGEYEKAEKVMRALIERPTDDPNEQNTINNYVRPELAQALLAQREVAEALEILRELMDGGGRPTKQVVLSYCRGVSGWIEGAAGKINIIPGAAADAAELDKVIETLNAISNSKEVDKWTCDWYGYKFQLAYTYYVYATADWGPQDQRKKDSARRQLDVLVQEFGANFEGIETACEEADDELKARFGDDVLRRRFVWLWREVQ